jgi:LmbE family N-acetylglucosaminyl deacetylase
MTTAPPALAGLPAEVPWASALAVVAHPDDESFGLGALLAGLADTGRDVRVLCLTHGEASTLGARSDLADVRRAELTLAAARLGVTEVTLLDFPDGHLTAVSQDILDDAVDRHLGGAQLLVVFEPSGVTGHLDHRAATAAAQRVGARHGLAILEWGVVPEVASTLRNEIGVRFVALEGSDVTDVTVDRTRQMAAILCHTSQATDNPVLARRLALQGDSERVRFRSAKPDVHPLG